MQVVDNGTPAQIEEILAYTSVAGASALPSPHMGQRMLNSDSLAQFRPTFWRQFDLPLV